MHIALFGAAGWLGRAVLGNLDGKHTIRAIDRSREAWQAWKDVDGKWEGGEIVHGDITDFSSVESALEGVDAVIHATAFFPGDRPAEEDAEPAFSINVRGLWNILEASRRRGLKRVVHVGSCQSKHSEGVFFTADIRRPDASLYAVTKAPAGGDVPPVLRRPRPLHRRDAFRITSSTAASAWVAFAKNSEESHFGSSGWVCRHDLAEACRLAVESDTIDFDIFHAVGEAAADATCDVARSRDVLGLTYQGALEQYRTAANE